MLFTKYLKHKNKKRLLGISIGLLIAGLGIYIFTIIPTNACKEGNTRYSQGEKNPNTGCVCDPDGGGL